MKASRFTRTNFDCSLYLVTDRVLMQGRDICSVVRQAVEGGVTLVQLREKNLSTREFVEIGKNLKVLLAPYNVPLIINDRLDVALVVDADGLHLGQEDLDPIEARKWLGTDKLLGISVGSDKELQSIRDVDLDYVGVGPVYATNTKHDAGDSIGVPGFNKLRQRIKCPVVGIGGINVGNAAAVMQAGASGIAVISSICSADNPNLAARDLRNIVEQYR